MRASTTTKLPLATFARIMGMDPLHFAGIEWVARGTGACKQPLFQYEWQDNDRSGREEIARAIRQAEDDIERFVGYRLLPSWEAAELHTIVGPGDPDLISIDSMTRRGFHQAVTTDWKRVVSGGVRATTAISALSAIAWSDPDGDGYKELGTVSAAYSGTDACEIRLYYPTHGGDPAWEIRPLQSVTISGGVVTVTFRRELAVLESIQERLLDPVAAVATTDADFLANAALYREYNDPQTQVTYLWEPTGDNCGCVGGCIQCAFGTQTGCMNPRNARLGVMFYQPGTWNAVTGVFDSALWAVGRQPDQARLYYLAGLQDQRKTCPRRDLDDDWARTVAIYAASILDRNPCSCSDDVFQQWRDDLGFIDGAAELAHYDLSPSDLDCPFGTRRGAIYAWKRILRRPDARVATQAVAVT